MIFKTYQPLTGKWFLWDNICLAKVRHLEGLPEPPHDPENFVNLLPNTPLGEEKEQPLYSIVCVDLIFKDGPTKEVVFESGSGYLMNDDGKTIEKL